MPQNLKKKTISISPKVSFIQRFNVRYLYTIKSLLVTGVHKIGLLCRVMSLKHFPISFFGCRETAQISLKERGTSS